VLLLREKGSGEIGSLRSRQLDADNASIPITSFDQPP
jgi:hypothetical protein